MIGDYYHTASHCASCGRPIGGPRTYIGDHVYHTECTRGPGYTPTYEPMPFDPSYPRCETLKELTEADVRRIVRDELAKQSKEGEE